MSSTAISQSGGGMERKAYRGKLGQELHFCLGVAERFPEVLVGVALLSHNAKFVLI